MRLSRESLTLLQEGPWHTAVLESVFSPSWHMGHGPTLSGCTSHLDGLHKHSQLLPSGITRCLLTMCSLSSAYLPQLGLQPKHHLTVPHNQPWLTLSPPAQGLLTTRAPHKPAIMDDLYMT
jgi:hypothetical protein